MIHCASSTCLPLILLAIALPSGVTAIGHIRGKVVTNDNEHYVKSSVSSRFHDVDLGTQSFEDTYEQKNGSWSTSISMSSDLEGAETSDYFAEKLELFGAKYPRIRLEDSKALVLREILLELAEDLQKSFSLEETLALILNMEYDEMESIFGATHHEGFTDEVSEAFEQKLRKYKRENPDIPTLAAALERLDGNVTKAFVLRDLLVEAAESDYSLDKSLSIIDIDDDEMESIFHHSHEDLLQDVQDAFEASDERQQKLGQDISRYLQEHLVKDEDGTLHYHGNKDLRDGEVEKEKAHHRRLEHNRRLLWDKYCSERELLPQKLREHGQFMRDQLRNLSGEACGEEDEAVCFSEELKTYEVEVETFVIVVEEEMGPCKSTADIPCLLSH